MNILFRATIAAMIESLSLRAVEAPAPMADQNQAKPKITRNHFTFEEDSLLTQFVEQQIAGKDNSNYRIINFKIIASFFYQVVSSTSNRYIRKRNEHQLRERWEVIDPSYNKGPWTLEEDRIIIEKVQELGQKWTKIAYFLEHRSRYDISNRWNHVLRKRLDALPIKNDPSFISFNIDEEEVIQSPIELWVDVNAYEVFESFDTLPYFEIQTNDNFEVDEHFI